MRRQLVVQCGQDQPVGRAAKLAANPVTDADTQVTLCGHGVSRDKPLAPLQKLKGGVLQQIAGILPIPCVVWQSTTHAAGGQRKGIHNQLHLRGVVSGLRRSQEIIS